MSIATAIRQSNDFVILGPSLGRDGRALEAIHALYFLPENYKLVFTGGPSADQSFYKEALSLVERDELHGRVDFTGQAAGSNAVIVDGVQKTKAKNAVSGDSPEALASAILNVARAAK
jgi:hypothetical protein